MVSEYTKLGSSLRRFVRSFSKTPETPDYSHISDICDVTLLPRKELTRVFSAALKSGGYSLDQPLVYLEFGVFNGSSLACMHNASKEGRFENLKLIGVDSFQGLPDGVEREDEGVWFPGQFSCSKSKTIDCLKRRNLSDRDYHLVSTWFDKWTHEELKQLIGDRTLSVVMIDCDAYSSAKSALDLIEPFISHNTVIFFDDWRLYNLDLMNGGEYRAFNEWRSKHNAISVKKFKSYNWKSEAFVLSKRL